MRAVCARRRWAAFLAATIAAAGIAVNGGISTVAGGAGPSTSPYVVLYNPHVDAYSTTAKLEGSLGFEATAAYQDLDGFSAELTPTQVQALSANASVSAVAPDDAGQLADTLDPGGSVPYDISRVGAATGTTVDSAASVAVAVLDTGADMSNPSLTSVRAGKNCAMRGQPIHDGIGHGTAVTGVIAAANNGVGIVGAAPGTTVYEVQVVNETGMQKTSWFLCGVDWVIHNAKRDDIRVVNMSLDLQAQVRRVVAVAIARLENAGVTVVAAAANWAADFSSVLPAALPDVLTVTAMAGGSPTSTNGAATFSSFATTPAEAAHTVAAPGVSVYTTGPTYPNLLGLQNYGYLSGTSLAAPFVTAEVALCYGDANGPGPCAGLNPPAVQNLIMSDTAAYNALHPTYGYQGDPAHPIPGKYYGWLVHFGAPLVP